MITGYHQHLLQPDDLPDFCGQRSRSIRGTVKNKSSPFEEGEKQEEHTDKCDYAGIGVNAMQYPSGATGPATTLQHFGAIKLAQAEHCSFPLGCG